MFPVTNKKNVHITFRLLDTSEWHMGIYNECKPQSHAELYRLEYVAGHCLSNHEDHQDLYRKTLPMISPK